MSAPDSDPEKQTFRHFVPIIGIVLIVIFTILGFIWWTSDEISDPDMPGGVTGPVDDLTTRRDLQN